MFKFATRSKRARLVWAALLCIAGIACLSGCQELNFYRQAAAGQLEILGGEKPVAKLLADPSTPPELKAKFGQINKIRQFAADQLKLPAAGVYVNYTDLHRPYVVWNVNVAPALSLDPKTWWFPIVGEASYRGYFHEAAARRYADRWAQEGWDVYVDGVDAYSTLGWFSDPLLNTFIDEPEADLADLIFHELAHRRLFIAGDTDFNEAFAMETAAEGVRRFFASASNTGAYRDYETERAREKDFVQLVMDARKELAAAYADAKLSDLDKFKRKDEIIAQLRARYAAVKKSWGGYGGYDDWFSTPINNAKLNTVSAYYDLMPAFAALLRAQGGDLEKFYGAVAALGKMPLEQRHEALRGYLKTTPAPEKSH